MAGNGDDNRGHRTWGWKGEGWREFQVSTIRISDFPSVLRCPCLSVSPGWTGRYKRNKSIIKKDRRVEKPQPRFTRQRELVGGYVAVFWGGPRGGRGDPEWDRDNGREQAAEA